MVHKRKKGKKRSKAEALEWDLQQTEDEEEPQSVVPRQPTARRVSVNEDDLQVQADQAEVDALINEPIVEWLNKERSRRVAIAFLFVHKHDCPTKESWSGRGGTGPLIKEALGLYKDYNTSHSGWWMDALMDNCIMMTVSRYSRELPRLHKPS